MLHAELKVYYSKLVLWARWNRKTRSSEEFSSKYQWCNTISVMCINSVSIWAINCQFIEPVTCKTDMSRTLLWGIRTTRVAKMHHCALWGPYILRRVDQLDKMFFGHFKYAARHFMTSKWFFCKKKFWGFRGRRPRSRSKLTVQHQMGYRWNRLDLRNSKMSTENSETVSVRF